MKLRCKPGDIALLIPRGVLVSVIRRYEVGERVSGFNWITYGEPAWVCESMGSPIKQYGCQTNCYLGEYMAVVCDDSVLIPLRKESGEDEMLRITGKPADKPMVIDTPVVAKKRGRPAKPKEAAPSCARSQ